MQPEENPQEIPTDLPRKIVGDVESLKLLLNQARNFCDSLHIMIVAGVWEQCSNCAQNRECFRADFKCLSLSPDATECINRLISTKEQRELPSSTITVSKELMQEVMAFLKMVVVDHNISVTYSEGQVLWNKMNRLLDIFDPSIPRR